MVHKHQEDLALNWSLNWTLDETLKIFNPSGKRTDVMFQGKTLEAEAEVLLKGQEIKAQHLVYRFAEQSFEMSRKEPAKEFKLVSGTRHFSCVAVKYNL